MGLTQVYLRMSFLYCIKIIGYQKVITSNGKNIKQSTNLNRIPPLIKGYLRAGGMVSENFYIDKEFETIDYCVIMLTEKLLVVTIINF